jgi:hypothetical protein
MIPSFVDSVCRNKDLNSLSKIHSYYKSLNFYAFALNFNDYNTCKFDNVNNIVERVKPQFENWDVDKSVIEYTTLMKHCNTKLLYSVIKTIVDPQFNNAIINECKNSNDIDVDHLYKLYQQDKKDYFSEMIFKECFKSGT